MSGDEIKIESGRFWGHWESQNLIQFAERHPESVVARQEMKHAIARGEAYFQDSDDYKKLVEIDLEMALSGTPYSAVAGLAARKLEIVPGSQWGEGLPEGAPEGGGPAGALIFGAFLVVAALKVWIDPETIADPANTQRPLFFVNNPQQQIENRMQVLMSAEPAALSVDQTTTKKKKKKDPAEESAKDILFKIAALLRTCAADVEAIELRNRTTAPDFPSDDGLQILKHYIHDTQAAVATAFALIELKKIPEAIALLEKTKLPLMRERQLGKLREQLEKPLEEVLAALKNERASAAPISPLEQLVQECLTLTQRDLSEEDFASMQKAAEDIAEGESAKAVARLKRLIRKCQMNGSGNLQTKLEELLRLSKI